VRKRSGNAFEVRRQRHLAVTLQIRQYVGRKFERKQVFFAARDDGLGAPFEQQATAGPRRFACAYHGEPSAFALDPFDQDFRLSTRRLACRKSRLDHARVVEDEKVSRTQQRRQVGKTQVGQAISHGQQTAVTPVARGVTRNELARQLVVEVGNQHGRA
jgi:hypothetical protein